MGRFLWAEVPEGTVPTKIIGETKFAKDKEWIPVRGGNNFGNCLFYGEDVIKDKHDQRLAWPPPAGMLPHQPPLTTHGKWFAGMKFKHWSHDQGRDARIVVECNDEFWLTLPPDPSEIVRS